MSSKNFTSPLMKIPRFLWKYFYFLFRRIAYGFQLILKTDFSNSNKFTNLSPELIMNNHCLGTKLDWTGIWTILESNQNCTAWWNSLGRLPKWKMFTILATKLDWTGIWTILKFNPNCTAWWNSLRRLPKWKTFTILALNWIELESGQF